MHEAPGGKVSTNTPTTFAPAALARAGAGEGVERLRKGGGGEGDAARRRPEAVAARGEEIGGKSRARQQLKRLAAGAVISPVINNPVAQPWLRGAQCMRNRPKAAVRLPQRVNRWWSAGGRKCSGRWRLVVVSPMERTLVVSHIDLKRGGTEEQRDVRDRASSVGVRRGRSLREQPATSRER